MFIYFFYINLLQDGSRGSIDQIKFESGCTAEKIHWTCLKMWVQWQLLSGRPTHTLNMYTVPATRLTLLNFLISYESRMMPVMYL